MSSPAGEATLPPFHSVVIAVGSQVVFSFRVLFKPTPQLQDADPTETQRHHQHTVTKGHGSVCLVCAPGAFGPVALALARFQANEPEMMLPLQDLSPLKHVSTVFAKQTYR